MSELESHLASKAAEGAFIEDGSIKLNPRAAFDKLGRHALKDPLLWLVKIVQSAVACGADSVRVTMQYRRVIVRFANRLGWQADDILDVLTGGKLCTESSLLHLQFGLMTAVGPEGSSVSWSCRGTKLSYDGNTSRRTTIPESDEIMIESLRPTRPLKLLDNGQTPVLQLFKRTAYEFKALLDYCYPCPIPITVDGFQVPRSYIRPSSELPEWSNYDSERSSGQDVLLAVFPISSWPERPTLAYPIDPVVWPEDSRLLETSSRFGTQHWKPISDQVQGVVSLHYTHQRDSEIVFLWDGAVVDSRPLKHPRLCYFKADRLSSLAIRLYLEVDQYGIDLSHFKVRDLEPENLIDGLVETLIPALEDVLHRVDLRWSSPPSRFPAASGWVTKASLYTLAVPLTVILSPLLLLSPMMVSAEREKLKSLVQLSLGSLKVEKF